PAPKPTATRTARPTPRRSPAALRRSRRESLSDEYARPPDPPRNGRRDGGRFDATGVDIEAPASFQPRLGPHARESALELPGLAEPEAIRHYVRLSRNNYSIDAGIYPLGSCTMKH